MKHLRNTIATGLARARKKRGLSQSQLAKLTGLLPSAVAHFEAARRMPTVGNLSKLADALGISIDDLFGRDAIGTPRGRKRAGANPRKTKQK